MARVGDVVRWVVLGFVLGAVLGALVVGLEWSAVVERARAYGGEGVDAAHQQEPWGGVDPAAYTAHIRGPSSSGSGVVVAPNRVLTVSHVVGGQERDVEVSVAVDGAAYVGRAECVDQDVDLTLLRVSGLDSAPVRIKNRLPDRGTRVLAAGHPADVPLAVVTDGRVVGVMQRMLVTTAPGFYGNSGGGVYAAGEGGRTLQLVGVMRALGNKGDLPYPHLNGAIGAPRIKRFIHQCRAG